MQDTAPLRAAQPRHGAPCPSAGQPPAARSNPSRLTGSSFGTELQPQSLRSHRPSPSTINSASSHGAHAGRQELFWAMRLVLLAPLRERPKCSDWAGVGMGHLAPKATCLPGIQT